MLLFLPPLQFHTQPDHSSLKQTVFSEGSALHAFPYCTEPSVHLKAWGCRQVGGWRNWEIEGYKMGGIVEGKEGNAQMLRVALPPNSNPWWIGCFHTVTDERLMEGVEERWREKWREMKCVCVCVQEQQKCERKERQKDRKRKRSFAAGVGLDNEAKQLRTLS